MDDLTLTKGLKAFNDENYKLAFDIFIKPAKRGDPWMQNMVGGIYEKKLGRISNYKDAIKWYTRSAEQNNELGQNNLGRIYERLENYVLAYFWYMAALSSFSEPLDFPEKTEKALERVTDKMNLTQKKEASEKFYEWANKQNSL